MEPVGPSWQPDPSGRHQFRWWTGAGWGDAVADGGVATRDPIEAVPSLVVVGRSARRRVVADPAPGTDVVSVPNRPIPTTVVTYDPEGARLAAVPRPRRPRPPLGRWMLWISVGLAMTSVAVIMAVRWWDSREQPGPVRVYTLDEVGVGVGRSFTVDDGHAVRLRVESGDAMVVEAYVLAEDGDTATEAVVIPVGGAGNGRVEGEQTVVVQLCCPTEAFQTAALVATADLELTLFVVSVDGTGEIRTIVEPYGGVPAGPDRSPSEVLESDFFSEPEFFEDTEPYTPQD